MCRCIKSLPENYNQIIPVSQIFHPRNGSITIRLVSYHTAGFLERYFDAWTYFILESENEFCSTVRYDSSVDPHGYSLFLRMRIEILDYVPVETRECQKWNVTTSYHRPQLTRTVGEATLVGDCNHGLGAGHQ